MNAVVTVFVSWTKQAFILKKKKVYNTQQDKIVVA